MPAKSKQQQKFMGTVHALNKGDIKPSDVSKSVKDVAKNIKKSDAEDFASTKHSGLPRKVKEQILNAFKEYANKMSGNKLGGGGSHDYAPQKGLRDDDGYEDESVNEGMFSTIDQIKQDSKDVRDFVKNVFKDRDFVKMKNDKEFIKYLKSIYESKGVPQNYMQGRTSDYHTALRGKNRDYSGGTNFKKNNHGHPDIEKDDEDQETNQLSVQQTKLKEEMGKLSSSERIELYKLYSKAMKAMPGSPNQKKLKVIINKLRKKADLKPLPINEAINEVKVETERYFGKKGIIIMIRDGNKLISAIFKDKKNADKFNRNNPSDVKKLLQLAKKTKFPKTIDEYGQRLDLSFIEDEEAKLDGTYPSTDAIDRDIDETAKRDYKDEYKKFQSSKKSKKYRAELNKYNRQKGTYGNGDGKDASHKGGKIVGFESASKNRGRKEKSRLKKESVVTEGKGAKLYFDDLKYNYQKTLKYLDSNEKKEFNKLAKNFFSKLKENVAPNHNDKSAPYGSGYKKVNEVGQFPVTNYIKGIIPQGRLNTNTPELKKQSTKIVKDLKNTLNNFWKSHDIPYRIR